MKRVKVDSTNRTAVVRGLLYLSSLSATSRIQVRKELKAMGHDIRAIFRTANYYTNYAVSQRSNDRAMIAFLPRLYRLHCIIHLLYTQYYTIAASCPIPHDIGWQDTNTVTYMTSSKGKERCTPRTGSLYSKKNYP